jgi:hypothetical protein
MRTKTIVIAGTLFASITLLMGDGGDCSGTPTADQRERQATEQLTGQASVQLGLPGITNFTEKRQLKMLYELRDSANLVTYAYYLDLNGGKHKICPATSVGYGLPYATQYSNPQKDAFYTSGSSQHLAMPQAEPNGLYMPAAAEGTWVICLDPDGKKLDPVYVEPRVIVSPFPMAAKD